MRSGMKPLVVFARKSFLFILLFWLKIHTTIQYISCQIDLPPQQIATVPPPRAASLVVGAGRAAAHIHTAVAARGVLGCCCALL